MKWKIMDKTKIALLIIIFADNVMSVMRTAGALLIGNSILVKFKIIGATSDYLEIALFGVLFGLIGSFSIEKLINLLKKGLP